MVRRRVGSTVNYVNKGLSKNQGKQVIGKVRRQHHQGTVGAVLGLWLCYGRLVD